MRCLTFIVFIVFSQNWGVMHIKCKNNESLDEEKVMKKYLLLNSDQTSLSDPIEYLPELLTDEIIWKRIGLTGAWIELLKPWNYWPNIETTENMTTFNKSQVLFKFWLKSRWTIIKIQNYLKCLKLYINKTFFFIIHIFTFQFIKIYLGIWKISDINTFFIWQS